MSGLYSKLSTAAIARAGMHTPLRAEAITVVAFFQEASFPALVYLRHIPRELTNRKIFATDLLRRRYDDLLYARVVESDQLFLESQLFLSFGLKLLFHPYGLGCNAI